MCLPDTDTCPICDTQYQDRISVITHLCDFRIRSKVRATTCAHIYYDSSPAPLPSDLVSYLNNKDNVARKAAAKAGYSHVLVRRPAAPSRFKRTKGTSNDMLKSIDIHGLRRRLSKKTPEDIANLRFKPRSYADVDCDNRPRKRIWSKSIPVMQNGPESGSKVPRTSISQSTDANICPAVNAQRSVRRRINVKSAPPSYADVAP